jgi:hypothetical protein
MPGGIFTSYRRADSAAFAGRIADFFSYRYPDVRVFFDVAAIEPGADFVDTIRSRLRSSEVVLAIIGDGWLSATDASGSRRLDDPNDFVRLELSMALSLGARVIPILLDNAQMPSQGQLPADLKPLAQCNAEFIRGVAFERDAQHLADFVREYLENSKRIMTAPPLAPARDVNSPVKLALVNAFARFRDSTADFMICENDAEQFVQFRKSPPDAVDFDLPSQTLSPKQLVAAGRLLTENYQAETVEEGDGNITYNGTLPLDPAFLSHTTLDVFEHVYGALPEKPLKITMNRFDGEPSAPARKVNAAVKLALVNAFKRFRDDDTADFIICENDAEQFVQFRKSPPDAVDLDLPSQTLNPKQLVAAGRLLTENYLGKTVELDDGNITYNATLPLDSESLSEFTLTVFEHVYGALPEKPLTITLNSF